MATHGPSLTSPSGSNPDPDRGGQVMVYVPDTVALVTGTVVQF